MSGCDLRHAGQGAGLRHLRGLVAILTVSVWCISFLSVDGEASYAVAHAVGTCVRIMVDDAHSRPPIQPIRKASARRIIAVWLMPFLRSPGWPASR